MSRSPAWTDPDRRRAFLLSVLVHALVLLVLVSWASLERLETEPPEQFLVIDVGTPAPAEVERPAAADDAPAPEAESPSVAADAAGEPIPGLPDLETRGDPVAEPLPSAESPAPPTPPAEATPEPPSEEPAAAQVPLPAPVPSARMPEAAVPAPAPEVTASVPEIEETELSPRPMNEALPVPEPSARATSGAVAVPSAAPEITRAETRPVPAPSAAVSAPSTVGLEAPEASTARPRVREVEAPSPDTAVVSGRTMQVPAVRRESGPARDLGAAPTAGVRALRALPEPAVQAAVRDAPEDGAPGAAANRPMPDAPAGGDAARAGQPGDDPQAAADARGLAGSPDGEAGAGGTPAVPPPPLRETRPRPLAVMIDNAAGYPQAGLPAASWIAEMPVEGGTTRLMAMFDAGEPERVGPVRSARDYFVEVAGRSDAVLVHDGGSPNALVALNQGVAPSINSYERGGLFERAASASAPYNLYSSGAALREAVVDLNIDAQRLLSGFRPAPPAEGTPSATRVDIDWGGAYESGFRYVPAQDRYRWIRNGEDAVGASGRAIQMDAVLVARIETRVVDPVGRLYIPVNGGPAQLYWRGMVQEGRWSVDGGLHFTDPNGNRVSLEALRTWASFVPQGQSVTVTE